MKIPAITRREFGKGMATALAASTLPLPALWGDVDSSVKGVKLGAITGSFNNVVAGPAGAGGGRGAGGAGGGGGRGPGGAGGAGGGRGPALSTDEAINQAIKNCNDAGVGFVELGSGFLEPRVQGGGVGGQVPPNITADYMKGREEVRQWRLNTPASFFQDVRKKFDAAGVTLYSMSYTFGDDMTDAEIDAAFRQMQALGIKLFQTNQTRVSMGLRMAPYAEKYKITPGWHTHQQAENPNEVSSPASLTSLLNMSPQFAVCLDIGHFAVGGNDPMAYFQEHHDRITHLHVKDQTAIGTGSAAAELGEGVLRVADMLKSVRDNHYPIAFIIEREYSAPGLTGTEETKKQMDWMRKVLES